jgi:hypothetical protein
MNIFFGYMVWCSYPDDSPEPEGEMFFHRAPLPGEGLILSDGKLWQVAWVEEDGMEVWVKEPSGNY